jgi:hypothetical protein
MTAFVRHYWRWIVLGLIIGATWYIADRANAPVPNCKIVDGREINNHRCIPYCPPDPNECA